MAAVTSTGSGILAPITDQISEHYGKIVGCSKAEKLTKPHGNTDMQQSITRDMQAPWRGVLAAKT
jgi:hypothetical protein